MNKSINEEINKYFKYLRFVYYEPTNPTIPHRLLFSQWKNITHNYAGTIEIIACFYSLP